MCSVFLTPEEVGNWRAGFYPLANLAHRLVVTLANILGEKRILARYALGYSAAVFKPSWGNLASDEALARV